jgi:exopolyphosphatase/guanosine-5'-triphosphate,3'-diphosphate pyrophosphatase
MKTAAVVDVGSNSVRLLTCKYDDLGIYEKEKIVITTRLGKDIEKNKTLNTVSINDSLDAFRTFKDIIDSKGINEVYAMATSAVRDSSNRDELLKPARNILGIDIEVIDGDTEAYVGYLGVLAGLDAEYNKDVMIIDIGGGSTELIIGDMNDMKYKRSIDVGAVRMTGLYVDSDPIVEEDYNTLDNVVGEKVKNGYCDLSLPTEFMTIGIGGTITTLGAMDMELAEYDPDRIAGYRLDLFSLADLLKKLSRLDNEGRKSIVGLSEKRADIILAGAVILEKVLDFTGSKEVFLSDCDNLEGYLKYIVGKR